MIKSFLLSFLLIVPTISYSQIVSEQCLIYSMYANMIMNVRQITPELKDEYKQDLITSINMIKTLDDLNFSKFVSETIEEAWARPLVSGIDVGIISSEYANEINKRCMRGDFQ